MFYFLFVQPLCLTFQQEVNPKSLDIHVIAADWKKNRINLPLESEIYTRNILSVEREPKLCPFLIVCEHSLLSSYIREQLR